MAFIVDIVCFLSLCGHMCACSSKDPDEERLCVLTWSHKQQHDNKRTGMSAAQIVTDMSGPCVSKRLGPRKQSLASTRRASFKEKGLASVMGVDKPNTSDSSRAKQPDAG